MQTLGKKLHERLAFPAQQVLGRSFIVAIVCLVWPGLVNFAFSANPNKPPFPPVVKEGVRWQQLPWQYDDVFLDHEQKPWFHLFVGYESSISGGQESVDYNERMTCLVSPEMPKDTIEIPGGNKRLAFDRQGRFWEIGKYGLAATDPRRGTFLQRAPLDPLTEQAARAVKTQKHLFFPFMFEHSAGKLYFIDFFAIHCLDGEEWTTHRFDGAPLGSSLEYSTASLKSVEAPDGQFFLWYPYRGSLNALIIHDYDGWSQISVEEEPRLIELQEVRPQRDGTVQLRSNSGGEFELEALNRKTKDLYPAVPEASWTSDRSPWAGADASLATDGPMSISGRVRGRDAEGRVYIRGHGEPNAIGGGVPVFVYDSRVADNVPRLPVEIVTKEEVSLSYRSVKDDWGRLWAFWPADEGRFLSRLAEGTWTHFPAPPLLFAEPPLPEDNSRELTKYQSLWVMRPLDAPDDWKPDRPGSLEDVPAMANPALIQPLEGDAAVAQEWGPPLRSYYFDGRQWTGYHSAYELVEAHYEVLREKLSNVSTAFEKSNYRWGRDSLGRIWVPGYIREPTRAYDGQQWQEMPIKYFLFDQTGERCWNLNDRVVYDTSLAMPEPLEKIDERRRKQIIPFVSSTTKAKRVWNVSDTLPSGAKLPEEFVKGNSKTLILEDTAGRYWLKESERLWVVRPDGKAAKLEHKTAYYHYVLAQQSNDIFWAVATDGLLQIRLHDQPDKPLRLELLKHYPRNVPQGGTLSMTIDDQGDLLISCHYQDYALCRVKIPPVDKKQPARKEQK